MARIPLQARIKNVTGSTDRARRKVIDDNALAERVIEHLHRLIARNPEQEQQYLWADIARELSLSSDEVGQAVMYGGHHGIRVVVTERRQNLSFPLPVRASLAACFYRPSQRFSHRRQYQQPSRAGTVDSRVASHRLHRFDVGGRASRPRPLRNFRW